MTSLHGLPPLPRSLKGLLHAGSAHWKEQGKLHAMRTSIQEDLQNGHHHQTQMNGGDSGHASPTRGPARSMEASLANLRREMVGLRQLDMSLLCQLWSLNESIQDYKHIFSYDRHSETNSECSSHSYENGLDAIPSIEEIEEDVEAEENLSEEEEEEEKRYLHGRQHSHSAASSVVENGYYNDIDDDDTYLEPVPCMHSKHLRERDKQLNNGPENGISSCHNSPRRSNNQDSPRKLNEHNSPRRTSNHSSPSRKSFYSYESTC